MQLFSIHFDNNNKITITDNIDKILNAPKDTKFVQLNNIKNDIGYLVNINNINYIQIYDDDYKDKK